VGERRRIAPIALVIALVAVAAVVVLFLTGGIAGSDDEAAEQVLAAADTTADPEILNDGWFRIDLPGTASLRQVWDVDGTLYAGGWDAAAARAVLWRSADGRDWQEVAARDGSFSGAIVNDVTRFEGITLALGARLVQIEPDGQAVPVPTVWRSSEGDEFLLAESVELSGPDGTPVEVGGISDVVRDGDRLVAVGWTGAAPLLEGSGSTRGGAWTSLDGVTFDSMATRSEALDRIGTSLRSVTTAEDRLIATGDVEGRAVVWRTAEDGTWEVSASGAVGDGEWSGETIVAGPAGPIALGRQREAGGEELTAAPLVWTSATEAWSLVGDQALAEAELQAVDGDAISYVAGGWVHLPNGTTSGAVWSSYDGLGWARARIEDMPPGASRIDAIRVFDGGVVAVGAAYSQPVVWFRPAGEAEDEPVVSAAAPLAPPAWATVFQEQVASGAAPTSVHGVGGRLFGLSTGGVIWTSEDGVTWNPALFADVGLADASTISDIVQREGSFVAVGDEEGTGLWISRDGLRWGRPSKAPPCCVEAVFVDERGFVALISGADGTWSVARSDDGMQWETAAESIELPFNDLWRTASVGRFLLVWASTEESERLELWVSTDGITWQPAAGMDGLFERISWEGVWDFESRVVAAGMAGERTFLVAAGQDLVWESIPLPETETVPMIRDVAQLTDGVAVALSAGGGPLRVFEIGAGGIIAEIAFTPDAGFGGLRATLVPGSEAVRAVGPDHGRMTVWEWIP
jgi:hypothetical protein